MNHYQCRKCSEPNSLSWITTSVENVLNLIPYHGYACSRYQRFGGHNKETLQTAQKRYWQVTLLIIIRSSLSAIPQSWLLKRWSLMLRFFLHYCVFMGFRCACTSIYTRLYLTILNCSILIHNRRITKDIQLILIINHHTCITNHWYIMVIYNLSNLLLLLM